MKATDVLVAEHKNIKRMLVVVRKLCRQVFFNQEVYYEGFYDAIDFIRNYADKFHHGKEEDIYFASMSTELGPAIQQGPIFGMLAEHDLGRLFIKTLEESLEKSKNGDEDAKIDIVSNAICYTDLLYRHIDKEDNAIFTFAESNLNEEAKKSVDEDFEKSKDRLKSDVTEKKYVELLERLEQYVASV